MKFKIEVPLTGNDAFKTGDDVYRALTRVLRDFLENRGEEVFVPGEVTRTICDRNGNSVRIVLKIELDPNEADDLGIDGADDHLPKSPEWSADPSKNRMGNY